MAKETFSFEEAAAPAAPAAPASTAATKPVTFSFEEAAAPAAKPASAATFSFEEAAGTAPAKVAPPSGSPEWEQEHKDRRVTAGNFGEVEKAFAPTYRGNIDLNNRKLHVWDGGKGYSSLESMTVEFDGKHVLIPKISGDGRLLSDDQAIQEYRRTGQNLGAFDSDREATKAAIDLERRQQAFFENGPGRKTLDAAFATRVQPEFEITDPSGTGDAAAIMAAAAPKRTSVLEGVQMPEPKFDPAEAQRLSRRDYAESHPLPSADGRSGAVMRPGGETKPADPMFERGAAIRDASIPVRAAFKAVSGIAKGAGGVMRSAGDLTGIPQLTAAGQATSAGADQFEQGMGDAKPVAGFGPKSPVPYLNNMAEGATSSLGQSAMMATSFGPRAVIPLLSVMTAGQEYERARNAGLDPAMALAGAIPKGTFEAIGEKFTGLDKVAGAMGTLLTRGASEQAKHTAADVLVHAGIREVPGEIITYLGQTATDLLPGIGLNPDLTMGQFLDGLRDTTVQAAMMGGAFGSGGAIARTDPRIKRLRDAGENEAADLLQKRQDQQNLQANVISELSGMQSDQTRSPEFQAGYIGLRADGTKPVEAAGRSALNAGFRQTATAAGMSEKAIAAALDASRKISLDKLPGFLQRYTQGLASRGAIKAPDAALGTLLEAARDDAMESATQSLYGDTRQTMDAAQALESGQNQAPAVDKTAPEAMNSVAPAESVQAVDNIERILGQQTTRPDIDQAAHAAATSPLNDLPEPTQAQKEAGNYQKGHINLHGLDIAIENPQGSERRGVSPDGKEWSSTLASHYGYIKRTNGNDGDHVDTFIGPNPDSTKVFVVDQLNKDGSFDEHKVMLGFDSLEDADRGYHANYEPGWTGRGAITEVPLPAFKSWVRDGKKKEPISAIQFQTQEAGQGQAAAGTEAATAPDQTANAGNGVEGSAARAIQPAAAADLQPVADQHPAVELSGKTPAQLAAMERAAQRLRLPNTGSGPLSAHAFIAAEGGLSRAAMADTGFDANVRVGNRWLFAAQGKGLTLEQAAMKLAQAGYLPTENESDAADLIRRSLTQPQYTADGWQALAEAEHAARYEDHLAAQQEADTGDDPLAPDGFTDAELEQSGYDDASPEVQAEVRALLATAEDQGIDAETVLEIVAKTTENATQQDYYEAAKRALQDAIAAQPGSAGDSRAPAGSESPAPGQEQDPGQVGQEPQQTPADAGVSVSGFTVEPRADGTLAVKGDAKAIREALNAIPAKLLVTMKGGILVGRTQAEKAQAILRGEKPKLTAREAAEAGERARQAEKKARQQAARAESTAAPAGLSIGIMPSTAEAVTVRNGIVFIGDNEAIGYDSGEPVTVAAGASDQQIVDALKEAGALSRRQRVFGLAKVDSEGLTAPTRENVVAQQDRAATAETRDQREQVRLESEAGAGQFSLTQEDGRQDTTGSLFDQPSKPDEQSALARGAPVWRSALRDGVATIPAKAQGADGWRAQIQGLVNKGAVKADEVEWSGVTDWLQMQTGKVTKEQVLDYLDGNGVQIEEVTLTGDELAMQEEPQVEQREDGNWAVMDPDTNEQIGGDYETEEDARAAVTDMEQRSDGAAKYRDYVLPGGKNYREMLLIYPTTGSKAQERIRQTDSALKNYLETEKAFTREGARDYALDAARGELTEGQLRFAQSDAEQMRLINAQRDAWIAREKSTSSEGFKSAHWDQQNVLAHIRVNDRSDADGKRVLLVEEIQSDWGQEGKKKGFSKGKNYAVMSAKGTRVLKQGGIGPAVFESESDANDYASKVDGWYVKEIPASGVPTAPFVGKTDAWLNLALKRIITMAAQEGYDRVAFVNGEQSADRYDLSKSIDSMIVGKEGDGTYSLVASRDGRELIKRDNVPAGELENLVGKEMAKKIVDGDGKDIGHGEREFSGIDLKVGGEGMKTFYDKIVPAAIKKLLPKVGGEQIMEVTLSSERFTGGVSGEDAMKAAGIPESQRNSYWRGLSQDERDAMIESERQRVSQAKVQSGFDITAAMRKKAAQGLPMFARSGMDADAFRRAFSPPQAMSVAGAKKIIDELTATWENGPKFKAVATAKELPIAAPRDTRGWVSEKGMAYIVASNHVSRDAIAQTLAHEAIGHYGLWKSLGKDGKAKFERNLQLALKTGNKPLAKIRDKVRRLYVDDTGKFNLSPEEEANEIAAFAVEEAVDPVTGEFTTGMSWLKQFWAQIADFLRGLGLPVKFTKAELHGLLVASMKGLQVGHRLDGGAEVLVAAARDASPEGKALQALGENDDLFALPRSDKTTVEGIAADNDPGIKVEKSKSIAETLYTVTMPDGRHALIWVRPANPYGERAYSMELNDGEVNNLTVGRPGENPEAVDPSVEDVYLDVSGLKPGSGGNVAYNIAATFAHNTGRIFIGDPTGLSNVAMRRRLENMISSALKFGTTDHLAPHPRQVKGDAKLGIPALRWVYGDSLGNIQRMIDVSLKADENSGNERYAFNPDTGRFTTAGVGEPRLRSGEAGRSAGNGLAGEPGARADSGELPREISPASPTWSRTAARAAVFNSLVRQSSESGSGAQRGRNELLAQLVQVAHQFPDATRKIFYARGQADESRDSQAAGGLNGALARGPANPGQLGVTPPTGTSPATIAAQPNAWVMPADTRTDRVIYELQDSRVDLKRVQQAIEAAGRDIAEQWDARLAETLYPGRVANRAKQFLDAEVRPLLKAMAVNKISMDEISDYLHARAAEERNAQIAKVNPDMPDGGAGTNSKGVLMTTQAARDYLDGINATRKLVLDAMAKHVDAITAGTRTLLVAEGLEKQETIDAWQKAYKHYVPMFRDEAESGTPHPQGTGFAVKGNASRRATGSTKQVTNMLAHVLMQREAAMTRAEKNRVALSLYGLALSHPNTEFWTTIKPGMSTAKIEAELLAMGVDPATAALGMERAPTIRTVDDATGKVVDRPNPMYRNLPGAIPLKVNGEDRVLMLNSGDERGARLAASLKNLDGLTQLDIAGSVIGKSTRWLAAVNTQYNPAFGLVNLTRDTLGGAINIGSTDLRGNALKVLAQTPAAIFGIARELATGKQTGKWGKLYQQFVADGGQTGYKEMWRDPHERARALEKEMKAEGRLTPGKAAHAILDLLDGFNTTLENAVRLSAYSASLDKGLSRAEAARIGRELTVDFNRKGRAGREVGPLYAFFNASVQGAARTIETLRGPTGAKVIAGGLGLGILQALMLAAAGYDDDEIPEFVKARALIIPLFGDGKQFISIPYPLGLHVIPNTGRVLAELVLNGGKDIGRRSVEAIGEIAAAFNPLGGGNVLTAHGALTTVAPTLVDPIIDLAANRNFAGNPIERKPFGGEADNRPGAARAKESTRRTTTGQVYIGISEAINRLTGGNQYEAGAMSPTPERIRYLAQTAGGGVLRELEKSINASTAAGRGEKVKSSQIPVFGRFYGEVNADQVQASRYFKNKDQIKKAESSFKAMEKAGDAKALEQFVKDHPEVLMAEHMNEMQKSITELNRLAVTTVNDHKQMADIDAARAELMKAANGVVKDMELQDDKKKGRGPTLGERLRTNTRETAPAN